MTTFHKTKKFVRFLLEVLSAALLGSTLAAGLAIAVPELAPVAVPAAVAQTTAPEVPLSQTVSHNWSGYVAEGNRTYTAVGGSWVVPTPSVASQASQADATWVGIGGVSSNDLIQAGTQAIILNGQVQYQAWVEMLPDYSQALPIDVSGGDSVNVSLIQKAPGLWHLTFINNTTGKSYQTDLTYNSSNSSAEWIEEMPVGVGSGYIPLDSFGSVSFTNTWTVGDGTRMSAGSAGAVPLKMGLSAAQLLATPGALAADGSFTVNRTDLALSTVPPARHHRSWSYIIPSDSSGYTVTLVLPFGLFR